MKNISFCLTLGIGLSLLMHAASAAEEEKTDRQKPLELDRYRHAVAALVEKYYPDAAVDAAYDKEIKAEKIHFQYNTQKILMRYRNPDGSWQEPEFVIGPYVGGIWCDITLHSGPYRGDVQDAEQGVTETGPDFYSYMVTPYSEKLDQHIEVKLRYPGGTPPEFLKQFYSLAKDFGQYLDKEKDP